MHIEKNIIQLCKGGNNKSQRKLYFLLLPYLTAICSRYIWDQSYKKDVLQEAFILIFKNIKSYQEEKGTFSKWATRILINTTISFNKRIKRNAVEAFTLQVHDTEDGSDNFLKMSTEDLLFILRKMPQETFVVFNLYIIDGFDHKEIADMLSISDMASRKRLSRARSWIQRTFINDEKTIFYLQSAINK